MRIAEKVAHAALTLAALACMAPVLADDAGAPVDDAATRARLKETLEQRFPIKVEVGQPAPFSGMYEVIAGEQVAYADPSGDYLLVGRLMDTRTRRDLSADHLDAHDSIDFQALPFGQAIRIVRGNGERQLAVFADPDCPYCQQLEKDLQTLTDITVFVFLFPLEGNHPGATAHARAIWCARDRGAAWSDWLIKRSTPTTAPGPCAADPIEALQSLGTSLRVHATPTLFLENGQRIGGYIPLDELRKRLAQSAPGRPPSTPSASRGP